MLSKENKLVNAQNYAFLGAVITFSIAFSLDYLTLHIGGLF